MPAQQGGHGIALAAEGDMGEVDALALGEVDQGEVGCAIGAGIAHAHLARAALGIGHQIGPCAIGALRPHADHEEIAGEVDDGGEIGAGIVAHPLHEGQAHRGQDELRQGVTIGPGVAHIGRGDGAAAAGAVFDLHRLAHGAGRGLGKAAHMHIGGAAGREGDLQGDGAVGEAALGEGWHGQR